MKYNLIFSGISESRGENTERVLRDFLFDHLEIDDLLEFANVHRFGKEYNGRPGPIIAKFLYQRDLDLVLKNARKLRGKPFHINRQFPDEIEQACRSLYPLMKELRQKGDRVKLVRDTLFVNGEPYQPEVSSSPPRAGSSQYTPRRQRYKRPRVSSTPESR